MAAEPLQVSLNDLVVQRTVGSRAFLNGRNYARQRRVLDLSVDGDDRPLHAVVQGTRPAPYRVVVTPTGPRRWSGTCTCPVGNDCKHVAAVMIAARGPDTVFGAGSTGAAAGAESGQVATTSRGRLIARRGAEPEPAAPGPPAANPSWEGPIAALVRARTAKEERAASPLALAFEVLDVPAAARWSSSEAPCTARQRIRIRPVVRGASGRWVRTGVSWRDLQFGIGPGHQAKAHREALRAIFAGYLANTRSYYGYGADATIFLDDFGPSLWHLLGQAAEAGLALVPAKMSDGNVIVSDAAVVSLDLRMTEGDGAVLAPVVAFGDQVLPADGVEFIGTPIHGLFLTYQPAAAMLGREAGLEDPPGIILAPVLERPAEDICDLLRRGQRLDIPPGDLPRFLHIYYPALRQVVDVRSSDGSVALPEVVPPRLALGLHFLPAHTVRLEWSFAYAVGGDLQHLPIEDADGAGVRDVSEERRLLAALPATSSRFLGPPLTLQGMDTVAFTRDVLPALRSHADRGLRPHEDLLLTITGEPPDYRHVELPPVIRISATDSPDSADWYDLAVSVTLEDEEIPFEELFVALANEQSHLVLDSGAYFSIERPEFEQLRTLIAEARGLQDRQAEGLRLSVYQAGFWEELRELGIVEEQSKRWAAVVNGLLDVGTVEPPALPAGFEAELRPYQRDGFNWLSFLWEHGLGGILADDMGLGKTIQALALICRAREGGELPGPFLVVAPTSVVGNWAHEAARFAPGLKVSTVLETTARRQTALAEDIAGADLVITSYALFRIDCESYEKLLWAGLLLDEAQNVKNHLAKTYHCARRLPAPFKLAITGTPLENSLMDLWALLSIVAPGLFPSPQRFSDAYRRPIERGDNPELLATLRKRIRPLMRRRTKDQVMAELPPKQEQILEVELNPRHQKIYQTHLQRERQKVLGLLTDLDKNRFAIFRSLTLLRQLSLHAGLIDPAYGDVRSSKADAFLDQLREVVSEGHRALVFSQFTGFLRVIRDQLDSEGIAYSYLDGRTRNRPTRIAEFKNGDNPVFLISLKAGGVGLNLTEADYCFILDPWWNPAVEAQAVDRTHRIGQDKNVMVYRLVAAGTIEEKVMALKARKQSLFTRVMDDGDLLSAPLSVEDIKGLFG